MADFKDVRELYESKVRPVIDKADDALDSAAAKVERHHLTKWVLAALAVIVVLAVIAAALR